MINQKVDDYINHHEVFLKSIIANADIPAERIRSAIFYSVFPGGKRLRPILVYLVGEILKVNPICLDYIAAAVELTHCYSLIHDDLPAMDNDDLRRGKPSCHRAFDEATAILAGDGMQALAVEILLSNLTNYLPFKQVLELVRLLVHASGTSGMVSGQSLDLSELAKPKIDECQLKMIHSLKTGKLFSACINMTLEAANNSCLHAKILTTYANYLGLVFQMQDDYLDCYTKIDVMGKGRASDRANKKFTFASLYSQNELLNLIHSLFLEAKKSLNPLGQEAKDLLAFTNSVQQRCSEKNCV